MENFYPQTWIGRDKSIVHVQAKLWSANQNQNITFLIIDVVYA